MTCRIGGFAMILGLSSLAQPGRADQFDQLDGPALSRWLKGPDVTPKPALSFQEIAAMPAWLRDSRSSLVLAATDRGNPVRLLLSPELRKPASGPGEPIPVLVLERLDAFDLADPSTRLSTKRDLVLFDGFQVDLDSGQVVPEGQGGDLVFRTSGEAGPRLESVGPARLFPLTKAPAFNDARVPGPTPGRAVVPADFAGRYRLFANGQWSGTLNLKVEPRGVVTGKFRSDLHGTTYDVTGQVAADAARKVRFSVAFPRARQEFEGYLWGEGKGAMAGLASLLDQDYGFFALREGATYAPEGRQAALATEADADRPGRILVEVQPAGLAVEGQPATLESLTTLLKDRTRADPTSTPWVLLRATDDRTHREVLKVARAIHAAGIPLVRFD